MQHNYIEMKSERNNDDYVLLIDGEEKKATPNTSLPIYNVVIRNGILPFLDGSDRGKFSSTARALRHIDPKLEQIHALEKLENIVEKEAKSVSWGRLLYSPRAFGSAFCSLFTTLPSTLIYFGIKMAVESPTGCDDGGDASCWDLGFGIALSVVSFGGLLCCAYPAVRGSIVIHSAYHEPRAYRVSKDNNLIIAASNESKTCAGEFNVLFEDFPLPANTTLAGFLNRIQFEKERIRFFIGHSAVVDRHVIDMDNAAGNGPGAPASP